MKRKVLTICAIAAIWLLTVNNSYGQAWTTSGPDLVTDPATNFVGIKTNTPAHELTVNGDIGYQQSYSTQRKLIGNIFDPTLMNPITGSLQILANTSLANGAGIELYPDGHTTKPGTIEYTSYNMSAGSSDPAHDFIFNDGTTSASLLTIYKNSNISIGTSYKTAKLNVGGSLWLDGPLVFDAHSTYRSFFANSDEGMLLYGKTGSADGGSIIVNSDANSSHPGAIRLISGGNKGALNATTDIAFDLLQFNNNNYTAHFAIFKNGKVMIGEDYSKINTTNDYRLYVQTGILTEKLKVANINNTAWADYVFEEDYDLKSLNEVENYIKTNKHLPDVPSASQVSKDGIDVAEMDATLLRKIEELTLYVIQQQKEIDELKSRLNK